MSPTWENYEKISDTIMLLTNKLLVKMNVVLAQYSKERRLNFHNEVAYYSNKANGVVYNIKRNYDFYLSIEHVVNKDFIMIGISDMLKLKIGVNEAYRFFTDPRYQDLYAKTKDGTLILYKNPDPVIITDLSMGNYLKFEPSIYENMHGELNRSIRIYLSSDVSYYDIPLRNFQGFKYFIDNFNMVESAQLMINYIQRPDFGTNLYNVNTEYYNDPEEDNNFKGRTGRTVANNNTSHKSYFDKMKGLEE